MDEAAQIEAWRKQMQAEEEEEYAAEQAAAASGRADMAAMRSTDGLPGGGTVRFREAQEERTIPSAIPSRGAAGPVPTREPPPAAAAAPAPSVGAGFDWNANTMQQLQEFQGQNAELQQALRKKERELERYKRDQELSSLTGGISAQVSPGKKGRGDTDPRDAKIVELAKKNRAMSLDVQRERDKASRLAGELKRTEQAMQMVQANPEAMRHATKAALPKDREKKQTWSLEGGDPDKGSASAAADVKALKDKLREANSRLNHQTVQAEKAKQELASVKRALAKEVGDGVDVKKVIAEGGGWRGRAQQISMLKDKLRESKRALDATRTSVQGAAPTLTMAEMQAQAQASAALAQDPAYAIDQKNRKHISELGRKGRRETEELEARLQQALDAKDAQRQKYEGASARVKNLEKDMKAMKAKVLLVLEKSTNDDKLIAALKEQVRVGGGAAGGGQVPMTAPLREKEAQIDRQEKIILALREEVHAAQQREGASQAAESDGDVAALRALHAEAEKMTELNTRLQSQLEEERATRGELESALKKAQMGAEMGVRLTPRDKPTLGSGPAPGGGVDAATVAEWKYRVKSLQEELGSCREELRGKSEEVELLQQALMEHQGTYTQAVQALSASGGGGQGYEDEDTSHLMDTNERLRDELAGIRGQLDSSGGR